MNKIGNPPPLDNHELELQVINGKLDRLALRYHLDLLLASRAFFGIIVHHRLLHEILGLPVHLTHEVTVEE